MKINWLTGLFILSLTSGITAHAEMYIPIDVNGTVSQQSSAQKATSHNVVTKRFNALQNLIDVRDLSENNKPVTFAECATPPTSADIGGDFELNTYVMTRKAAGKLGIAGGVGSSSSEGNGEQLLAVFDFSRFKECLATDNKTRVVYGQAVRTVMTFTSADNKTDVTFPLIAASATVAGKSSSVSVKNIGFNDSEMASKAAAMSAIPLSVESYNEFTKLHKELIALATAATTQKQVQRLGIVSNTDDDELKQTLPTAFALQAIKNGKSCDWAKQKLNMSADADAIEAVRSTYINLMNECSGANPSTDAKSKSTEYLRGMTVKL